MAFKRILLRRDTAANWTTGNAVLAAGEVGYETNTGKFKIGNGSTAWNSLAYSIASNISAAVLNDLGDVTITAAASGDFLRWNGSAWINDAVNLSTDTIGSYVESLIAGTGVTLSNNSGEGATPTVAVDTSVIQARVANVSDTEIGYLNGVTSAIQTQIDAKAPLASPTFTGTVTVPDNSFALGTKTTGDYVATITGGTGVSSTAATSGEGTTHTLSIGQAVGTTDNVTFAGVTADAIRVGVTAAGEIDTASGELIIDSFAGTTTIDDNLIITGNLNVNGTTTTITTSELHVSDNFIALNHDVTGTPTENAGVEVERGTSANVFLRWNEADDKWQLTNDGTTYYDIASSNDVAIATALTVDNLTDTTIVSAADGDYLKYNGSAWVNDPINLGTDTVGNYMAGVSAGTGISVTHTPGEGSTATIAVDATVATLASPAFTGTPTAPTAAAGTSTTQIATTEFVMQNAEDDQFILAGQIF